MRPFLGTQAAERGRLFASADIAADPVYLVGGDIQLIAAGVLQHQEFPIHIVIADDGKPEEFPDAVFDVHHVIIRLNIGEDFMSGDQSFLLQTLLLGKPEDFGIGKKISILQAPT